MKRDLLSLEQKGRKAVGKHSRFDLTIHDIDELLNIAFDVNGKIQAIGKAFYIGVEIGRRIARKEEKRDVSSI